MKDIKNYEGIYAITENGEVWSYKSKKFLKPKTKASGYLEVTLCKEGIKKSHLVHRLVAEAYIPNPEGLPQVSHIDESRDNNNVNNLCWASAAINCNMPLHLERKSKSQMNNATSKKVLCVELDTIYPSMSEAARQLECSPQAIRHAVIKGTKSMGYHWRYVNE